MNLLLAQRFLVSVLVGCMVIAYCMQPTTHANETTTDDSFSLPEGFSVERVADDKLVHDCFSMTTDSAGRPVVSGPGYIKTLVDDNQDGIYDRSIAWTTSIKQGAHGLWSEGRRLYWVSDGGIWQSEDTDGDLVADANVRRVLDVPTGGEHDAHALRRGPDGYWYLIAGNFANGISRILNDPLSPVSKPRAGTLWRISPDFSSRSAWAHGMRNGYDFDFLPDGQIVTYDSDCEREASLPWYRPTRVMVLAPGSDAGWCGQTWKDHDLYASMPQTIASLGRGSPTGVCVYDHHAFPSRYRGSVFVLDWTFGRVVAIYPSANLPEEKRASGRIPAEIFMQTKGLVGFAPTDCCVLPDGSLLICAGGRGTAGAIYRVSPTASSSDKPAETKSIVRRITDSLPTNVESVLETPNPWDSWSESSWRGTIDRAVSDGLLKVVSGEWELDPTNPRASLYPLRASQFLTRLGTTIPTSTISKALASKSQAHHAAAWWLLGRGSGRLSAREIAELQNVPGSEVNERRSPWEFHLGDNGNRLRWECSGLRKWSLGRPDLNDFENSAAGTSLRRGWLWALYRVPSSQMGSGDAERIENLFAKRLFAPMLQMDSALLDLLAKSVPEKESSWKSRERLEFLAMLQVALGDRKASLPQQTDPPQADVLDGYKAMGSSQLPLNVRKAWIDWMHYFIVQARNSKDIYVETEAVRTLGMLEPVDPKTLQFLLDQIHQTSHPTSDLQTLCCIAKCSAARDRETSLRIASALSGVVRKVKDYGLYTDNQWPKRIQQLVKALSLRDAGLDNSFLSLPAPSCAEDLALVNAFPNEIQQQAKEKMRVQLLQSSPSEWTPTVLKYCLTGYSIRGPLRESLRQAATQMPVRSVALELLSTDSSQEEYALFMEALKNDDTNLWNAAWKGLQPLSIQSATEEWPVLAKLVSYVLNKQTTLPTAPVLERCRQVAAEQGWNDLPASKNWPEWEIAIQKHLPADSWSSFAVPKGFADWRSKLSESSSLTGNWERGKPLFEQKCQTCHGGQTALGPSLSGVTKRFSREDLSIAIFEPSRQIPDRYRAVKILTVDGEIITGVVIYSAADGTTLYTPNGETVRINKEQIEEQAYSTESLMPSGLLDDRSPQDLADLYSYLSTLE